MSASVPAAGRDTLQWVDAGGTVHELESGGVVVMAGVEGRGLPPFELVEDEVPGQPGAHLRTTKTKVRELAVPLAFWTDEGAAVLRPALREWLARLGAAEGGYLRSTSADGVVREIACRYSGGLELTETRELAGPGFAKATAVFRAHEPYWQDLVDTVETITPGVGAPAFFPILPLILCDSDLFGRPTITNTGDVDAWPIWTLTGPATSVYLRNLTTGRELAFTYALPAGRTVTLDTRPGEKTITLDDGTNLFSTLEAGSALWPLAAGANVVAVGVTGESAATSVQLSYRRAWLVA